MLEKTNVLSMCMATKIGIDQRMEKEQRDEGLEKNTLTAAMAKKTLAMRARKKKLKKGRTRNQIMNPNHCMMIRSQAELKAENRASMIAVESG